MDKKFFRVVDVKTGKEVEKPTVDDLLEREHPYYNDYLHWIVTDVGELLVANFETEQLYFINSERYRIVWR